MYRGKHELPKKSKMKYRRFSVLLASLLLIAVVGVGATVAYLMDVTDEVRNTFSPTAADITVTEDFKNNVKKSVIVTNNGEIPVFVRATLAIYWTDAEGVIVKPNGCQHSEIVLGSGWQEYTADSGIYYYTDKLTPGASTPSLIDPQYPITTVITPEGVDYNLVIEVLTEAIQAEPLEAVQEAWGVTISNGSVTEYTGGDA